MQHYAAFIWVFTVCQNTPLGVSSVQRVISSPAMLSADNLCKHFGSMSYFVELDLDPYCLSDTLNGICETIFSKVNNELKK